MYNIKKCAVDLDGVSIEFETGKLANLADGAVTVKYGDTIILATAGLGNSREGIDFFPLMCDFEAKYYANGKMKGSRFSKREARPPDSSILTARMMDRPLRPLFNKNIQNDVQIIATLLQANGEKSFSATAITAGSMAVQLSGIPIESPVGAVRVGMRENGDFYLDPSLEEIENGDLDLVIAGTEDAILMVEAGAKLISNEKMVEAFEFAHKFIRELCLVQKKFRTEHEISEKVPTLRQKNEKAEEVVNQILSESDYASIGGKCKKDYKKSVEIVKEKLLEGITENLENEEFTKSEALGVFEKKAAKYMRKEIFANKKRLDGRSPDEIRDLYTEVGFLPRSHGSAIFQRGDTQALSVVTIGGPGDELLLDDPGVKEATQRYMHHYNFPPYSVGEVRMMRGTGRREIGHGALAERALKYVMPSQKNDLFPYTVRVVSEILACNGSSSMASVCGSTLCLMDAGIPIKSPIAGIAMGLVMDENGKYEILTDIQGAEDFDGDMDLKVCGNENGLTSLQMDIKLKGLNMNLLKEALEKAKTARKTILENMIKTIPKFREKMSDFAPRVISFKIDPDMIRVVIGKGGETIQKLCADFEVKIDIEDEGIVSITGVGESVDVAKEAVDKLTYVAKIGDVFEDAEVKNITDFGAFVEYLPGKEALVHISEIAPERINKVEDVLKIGQKVKVKLIEIDKMGRQKLSIKQA